MSHVIILNTEDVTVCGVNFCFDSSARRTPRNDDHRHLMLITIVWCPLRCVPLPVRPSHQIISARRGRHRYTRVAVWLRTSLQVTVTSAMHQTATASRAARKVLCAAVANQKTRRRVIRVSRRIRRTVIHPDVVHLRHQQQLKQVLIDLVAFFHHSF